jgi:hypothetical protein
MEEERLQFASGVGAMGKQTLKKCPACGSPISLDLYNRIIGIEHAKKAELLKARGSRPASLSSNCPRKNSQFHFPAIETASATPPKYN